MGTKASLSNDLLRLAEAGSQQAAQEPTPGDPLPPVLALCEQVLAENADLRAEVQRLRDELARRDGEQGRPQVRPTRRAPRDHSSERERRGPARAWHKSAKTPTLQADRRVRVPM